MALWLPALFLAGLLFSYLLALHDPAPHHVKIAVAAPQSGVTRMQHELNAAVPGGFVLQMTDTASEARSAVLDHDAVAAYVPDAHHPKLYGARADGASMESAVRQLFTVAVQHQGGTLDFHELVPTASGDGIGSSCLYLLLACAVPAYFMVVTMQRAIGFSRWAHVATSAGMGAVTAAVCYFTAAYGMDVIPRHLLALLYLFLMTQAVSLTTYGLVPFLGGVFPGVASLLFILLGVPSSGGAVPVEMIPGFFRFLHPVLPMGNAMDALRSVNYYSRDQLARPTAVLCTWIAGGAVLILLGYVKWLRQVAREREAGVMAYVAEPPVEDPTVKPPGPVSLAPRRHHFGEQEPMLTGRIASASGLPLAGVPIMVAGPHGHQLLRTRTDDNGEYSATGFSDGAAVVLADAAGYQPGAARLLLSAAVPVRQDFVLKPTLPDLKEWEASPSQGAWGEY